MILTVSDFPYGVGTNQRSKFPLSFNKKKGLQKHYNQRSKFPLSFNKKKDYRSVTDEELYFCGLVLV